MVFLLHEAAGHRTALGAETALQVHEWHTVALAIVHEQGWHAGGLRDPGVVRTEGGGRVHDARSVLRGHEITRNDAEGLLRRFHRQGPIDELLVAKAHQVGTLYGGEHLGFRRLLAAEVLSVERLGQQHDARLPRVAVGGLDDVVGDVRTDGEGGVGRQGPGRGRPCQEVDRQYCRSITGHAAKALGAVLEQPELGHHGGVGDVAVGARLVELVAAEARAGLGAVRLDGVALVDEALLVELGQQPPDGLHVFRLVGHVGRVHVDPVAHAPREVVPLLGVAHDGRAARVVVFLDGNLAADVLLGDAEGLLHPEFHRQSVGVPTGLALDPLALQCLVTAEDVLQRTGHHVVDARLAIGRGWTFEEHEAVIGGAGFHAAVEHIALLPLRHHLARNAGQVEGASFGKSWGHRGSSTAAAQRSRPVARR